MHNEALANVWNDSGKAVDAIESIVGDCGAAFRFNGDQLRPLFNNEIHLVARSITVK